MNIPLNQFNESERATIIDLLGVLSESFVEAKTPTQRFAILEDKDFLFAELSKHEPSDA
jgi:hypothetical protein